MILIPIADIDFDPSETAIPWKILRENNIRIVFSTASGRPGKADQRMLTGAWLGIRKIVLPAGNDAVENYEVMVASEEFQNPIEYNSIDPAMFDGIILPGGHAPGVKPYLESKLLQKVIAGFLKQIKQSERSVTVLCW